MRKNYKFLIFTAVVASQISRNRQEQVDHQDSGPDAAMQLTGRYVVGMKSILGSDLVMNRSLPQLKKSVETSDNPRKYIFFTPIVMELTRDESNLTQLELLAQGSADDLVVKDASIFLKLYRQGSDSRYFCRSCIT